MERRWVPHDEHGFCNCMMLSQGDGVVQFMSDTGEQIDVPEKDIAGLAYVRDDHLTGIDNVCNLGEVSESAVLSSIRVRYLRKEIYTRVARIVVALNPFQTLNIYSSHYLDQYSKANDSMDLPPHVYGVGLDAVNGLRRSTTNQAILISGESGAGKTETTKLVLTYVANAIQGVQGIEDKIQQTSPILEAFGNAMTVRNNNSSRFGKWLELSLSKTFQILGCSITDYLLELTRVVSQGPGERNYHVFFQVLSGTVDTPELSGLGVGKFSDYKYLAGSVEKAPGIDDREEFQAMKDAFTTLNFAPESQTEIFKIVLGVLALGNVEFKDDGESCSLASADTVPKCAALFGVNAADLEPLVTTKRIVVGKEVTVYPLKANQACAARDGLSRLIYGRLFKLLIRRINTGLVSESAGSQFFGVLDVAGFESFAVNSLEQLFINLGNEHLQDHFNSFVFKKELEDYEKEGVSVGSAIEFKDNSDIVALIGEKGGILSILDDEATVPRATDTTFVNKIQAKHEQHSRFVKDRFGKCIFGINHFAGLVTYSGENFLEKNIDNPPAEAADLIKSSSYGVLKEIGAMMAEEVAATAPGKKGGAKTVAAAFRASLAQLLEKLRNAEPNFIRCVKPNAEKVPDKFTAKLVREQLVLSGAMEAVRIRQQGYASRIPFQEFIGRYRCVVSKDQQRAIFGQGGPKELIDKVKLFLAELPNALQVIGSLADNSFVTGSSKVFAKVAAMGMLDQCYDLAVCGNAVDIQRLWKGHQTRKLMKSVKIVAAELKAWKATNPVYAAAGSEHSAVAKLQTVEAIDREAAKLLDILARASALPVSLPNLEGEQKTAKRMENESKVLTQVHGVQKSVEPIELDKAIARASDLEFPEAVTSPLVDRRARLKAQIPVCRAMEAALAESSMSLLQEAWDEAVTRELVGPAAKPSLWVDELGGKDISAKVSEKLEALKKAKADEEAAAAKKKAEEEAAASAEQLAAMKKAEAEAAEAKKREEEESARKKAEIEAAEAASGRKKTITGLSMEDQQRFLLGITAAMHELDADLLGTRLAEATEQGMDSSELEAGESLLENLNREVFLTEFIELQKEKVTAENPEAHDLRCLQNLVKQATRLDICFDAVQEAKMAMQKGIRKRQSKRATDIGVSAEEEDTDEMQLAKGAFEDLASFPNLRPVAKWKGHVSSSWMRSGEMGADFMLYHNRAELVESLTLIPEAEKPSAIKSFRNILGWMHDKPVPEVQRLGYAQDIVDLAKKSPEMGDEIYVQLLKQLTRNPSRRSFHLGWKLVLELTMAEVCPSPDLIEFVKSFIVRAKITNAEDHFMEVVDLATTSLQTLNALAKPAAAEPEDVMTVAVSLIDGSMRKLKVKTSTNLEKLSDKMAELMKIHKKSDFSFFQVTDGMETHRLLPEHAQLQKLFQKWQQLEQVTKRSSHLLWKRRFLRVDERLQPGDLMHAALTYRQALFDYFRYPIYEDVEFLCKIAGTIMCIEHDHYDAYIKEKRLHETGILEHLLPETALRNGKRPQLAQMALAKFSALQAKIDHGATRIQKMSYIVSLMQKMKLFGACYWAAKQVWNVPPDKVSIPEAPEENCKINNKGEDDEYWVVVDAFGVRFVNPSSGPGKQFQRGFLFHDEAMERIIRWGAKQNIVEFVVQTINPSKPKAGRQPMTIRLASTGAVDIAYAIHSIQNERRAMAARR